MKKIILYFIILSLCATIFYGCTPNQTQFDQDGADNEVVEFTAQYMADFVEKPMTYNGKYSNTYFDASSFVYSTDLAKFAGGLALASQNSSYDGGYVNGSKFVQKYFNAVNFGNIYVNNDYYIKPTPNTLGVAIASKQYLTKNIVLLTIRSSYYEREWIDNMDVGPSGDHNGFKRGATKAYRELKQYMQTYSYDWASTKILICGFSRGGSIANLLGGLIDDDIDSGLKIPKENLFVYTYNSLHASMNVANCANYKNIHNIYNSQDAFSNLLNNAYGFVRLGNEYDIYRQDASSLLSAYDTDFEYTPFAEQNISIGIDGISFQNSGQYDAVKWYRKAVQYLMVEPYQEGNDSLCSRSLYCDNLYEICAELFDFYFSLDSTTIYLIKVNAQENLNSSMVLSLMSNKKDTLFDFVVSIINGVNSDYHYYNLLDNHSEIEVDEVWFSEKCEKIQNIFYNCMQSNTYEFLSCIATLYKNIDYFICNHIAQMVCVLLN